jgi:phenylacetate-CoA ligase
MPLIRYAVGDIAVGAGDRQCPCGRGFELLESIEGRDSDFVSSPSGKRYVVHFFALVIEHYPQVQQYQVVQNSADSIVIRLVTDSGRADFAPAMVKDFRKHGLTDMKIEIVPVSHIPSSPSGKRRFVMNEATKLRPSVVGA